MMLQNNNTQSEQMRKMCTKTIAFDFACVCQFWHTFTSHGLVMLIGKNATALSLIQTLIEAEMKLVVMAT